MLMTQFDGKSCELGILSVHGSLMSLAVDSRAFLRKSALAGREEAPPTPTAHVPWL